MGIAVRVAQRLRRTEDAERNEEPEALRTQSSTAKDVDTADANSGGVAPEKIGTESTVTSRPRRIRSWMLSRYRRSPAVIASGSLAVLVAVAYQHAPPMGRDY
jgi:hypothetical protein